MTKTECLARAAKFREQLDADLQHYAFVVVTFGGGSDVAKSAERLVEQSRAEAKKWEHLAAVHPRTRSAVIRSWAR